MIGKTHNHRAVPRLEALEGFVAPVIEDPKRQCREAHGNVTRVDTCKCGARRRVNVNGRHVEIGRWS